MRTNTTTATTITALVLAVVLGTACFGIRAIAADGGPVDAAAPGHHESEPTTVPDATPRAVAASPRTSVAPDLHVTGADAAQRAALDEAVARFSRERLTLPDLDVTFSDDMSDCRGHYGLFVPAGDPWQVSICSDVPFVITHELAHAWTAAHLDDAERDAYAAQRGLAAWDGTELAWDERGTEDAAFIIQQNLMSSPARVDTPRWIERMAAYELLTGQQSPVGGHHEA